MTDPANPPRAFWITAPGTGEIRAADPGPADGNTATVRTLWSGISRGTERVVFAGAVPESEYARMRAPFQEGEFPGPVKYGYLNVGEVLEGPDGLAGNTVFSLFPHQDWFRISPDSLFPLPDGVPPRRGVLAAQMETAVNAVWDADPETADTVAVIGAGPVGLLTAWRAARSSRAKVVVIDQESSRAEPVAALGLDFMTPDRAVADLSETARIVLHATGNPAGLDLAFKLAAFEARVIELSWYGDQPVPVALGGAFHSRRLSLVSSQVGHVAGPKRGDYSRRERLALAVSLLDDPALDVLLTGETAFDDMPAEMPYILNGPAPGLCHTIRYP